MLQLKNYIMQLIERRKKIEITQKLNCEKLEINIFYDKSLDKVKTSYKGKVSV
jgi:hypothetical protein